MRHFKTIDNTGQLVRLDSSAVNVSGEEITKTEYDMTLVGIKVFLNGESAEEIKKEDWWR
ncbi:MAG: hypothetical protein J6J13_00040 [Clostridia bacterium]|nr:hypothetical protein [Clostridia bacterium]